MKDNLKYADILANEFRDKDISDTNVRSSVYEKARVSLKRVIQKNDLVGTPTEAKIISSLERTIAEFESQIATRFNDQGFVPEPDVSGIAEPEHAEMDEPRAGKVNSRKHLLDFRRYLSRFGIATGVGFAAFFAAIVVGTVYFNSMFGVSDKVAQTEPQLSEILNALSGEALLSALRTNGRSEASLIEDGSVRIVSIRQEGATDQKARPIVLRYPREGSAAFKDKTVLATIRMRQEALDEDSAKSTTKVRVTLSPGEIVDPVSKVFEVGADSDAYFIVALTTNGHEDTAAVTLRFNTDLEPLSDASAIGKAILLESVRIELY